MDCLNLQHHKAALHTLHYTTTACVQMLRLPLGQEAPVVTPSGVTFLFFYSVLAVTNL